MKKVILRHPIRAEQWNHVRDPCDDGGRTSTAAVTRWFRNRPITGHLVFPLVKAYELDAGRCGVVGRSRYGAPR